MSADLSLEQRRARALQRLARNRSAWLETDAGPEAASGLCPDTRQGTPPQSLSVSRLVTRLTDWLEHGGAPQWAGVLAPWLRHWWRTSPWGHLTRSAEGAARQHVLPALRAHPLAWGAGLVAVLGVSAVAVRAIGRRTPSRSGWMRTQRRWMMSMVRRQLADPMLQATLLTLVAQSLESWRAPPPPPPSPPPAEHTVSSP
jgi:hypothetical protein